MTLFEFDENHSDLKGYNDLAEFMLGNEEKVVPTTFTDTEFDDFIYDKFY
jgi:hypothetical protein